MATKTFKSNTYDGRYLELKLEQTQDIENNKSTIKWTLSSIGGSVNFYSILATSIKINGTGVYSKGYTDWSTESFPAAKGSTSGSITVTHNTDGSLTVPVVFSTAVYSSAYQKDYGGNYELTENPRAATITSAPSFNDESSPKITYNNTAGSAVTTLDVCITKSDKNTAIASYRSVSKTGTEYTFSFTDAERKALRQYLNVQGGSKTVYFLIRTKIGSDYYYNAVGKTASIKDGKPIIEASAYDTGTISTQLTGDSDKLIKGYNTLNARITATAQKEASIVSTSITNGSNTVSGSSAIYNNTESNTVTFSATDSRGFTTSKTITLDMVSYIKPTCILSVTAPTTDGVMALEIEGSYYDGSFGLLENALAVAYRIKAGNGDYGEWQEATPEIKDNGYTVQVTVTELDYRQSYTVQARAIDLASGRQGVESNEYTVKTIPVFDWGANDFSVNVPMSIEGQPLADFVIETGTASMGSNGTWQWRKWASGKAECWGKRNYGNMGVSTAWGGMFLSTTFTQNLPSGLFNSTPETMDIRIAHTDHGAGFIVTESATGASKTSTGDFAVCRATSLTLQQVYIGFNIIGTWK